MEKVQNVTSYTPFIDEELVMPAVDTDMQGIIKSIQEANKQGKLLAEKGSEDSYVDCNFEVHQTRMMHYAAVPVTEGASGTSEWVEIEPQKTQFLWFDTGFVYTTSDGTKIEVADKTNVKVMENKQTGEILITGAKDANITSGSKDVTITVKDSTINNLKSGSGNDTINIENSTVKLIETGDGDNTVNISKNSNVMSVFGGKGNDTFNVDSSYVGKLDGKNGQDTITVTNSTTDVVTGGNGYDSIIIENSTVKTEVTGGNDDDFIHITGSTVNSVYGNAGNDNILIEGSSNVSKIDGASGEDTIIINSSQAENVYGGNDNDLIKVEDSTVKNIDGGWGADTIMRTNAIINNIAYDKSDNVKNVTKSGENVSQMLESDTEEAAGEITESITSKYSNKNLTPEQEMQALVIDFFSQNLEDMKSQFQAQKDEDGALRGAYNFVRQLLDWGVSQEDIEKAIQEQERMVAELTDAMNGRGGKTFEEVFKKYTGVEYSKEKATEYMENMQLYSLASTGIAKADAFVEKISHEACWGNVIDDYIAYFGSEEKAIAELNELFTQTAQQAGSALFGYPYPISKVEIVKGQGDALYQIKITPDPAGNGQPETFDITDMPYVPEIFFNNMKNSVGSLTHKGDTFLNNYVNDFKAQFEGIMGMDIEDLQNKCVTSQIETFGRGTAFQKLIDKYCETQDGFAQKVSSVVQFTGMGLMVVGGIVTFFCPPAGFAFLEAGKYTALAGMFTDNAIELFDDLSSKNGLSAEEAWDNIKKTLLDLALLYSGAKINGVAASVKDYVFTETESKTLAFLAQLGTDTTLSLLTDLMLTGDVNLTGEGISQLLGIITGIAGAKIDAYTKEHFDAADVFYKNNDVDGAIEYLKGKGFSKKKIYKHFKSFEIERINNVFKNTGSIEKALQELSKSKILSKADIKNVRTELELQILSKNNIDITKYKGYDFNSPQGKLVAEDIEMYYKALTEGLDIKDLMVPKSSSIDIAMKNAKVGDIFEVEGSKNVFIKTADGAYKQLNMTKETYCRLFPPLDRYSSGQQSSGDCYLVSVLNSMMSAPDVREKLLSCFTEDAEGNVAVKMPNSDTEIIIKKGQKIEDLGVKSSKHMTGSLGMQLLEYVYKVDLVNSKINTVDAEINKLKALVMGQYNDYLADTSVPASKRNISMDEFRVQGKKSYDDFCKQVEKLSGKNIKKDNIDANFLLEFFEYSEGIMARDGVLTERGQRLLGKALGIPETETAKLNKIYKGLASAVNEQGSITLYYSRMAGTDESLRKQESIKNDIEKKDLAAAAEKIGGDGGWSSDVFKAFGFNSSMQSLDSTFFNQLINNPDIAKNYVFTAGTVQTKAQIMAAYLDKTSSQYEYFHKYPEMYLKALQEAPASLPSGIYGNHAYSFEIRVNEITGETEIVVTNPWSLSGAGNYKEMILSVEEFKKYFRNIYVATK